MDEKMLKCTVCNFKYCLKCRFEKHEGTCENYAIWKEENSSSEFKF